MGRPLLRAIGILILVAVAIALSFWLYPHQPLTAQIPTR